MLRISKLTDYATVVLGSLAAAPEAQRTAAELAAATHVAAPTVSKLLKQLQRAHLVSSARGLKGGYRLARPAAEITAAQIVDALEGPLALTACASTHHQCDLEATCRVGNAWQRVSLAIRRSLEEVTLADLAGLAPSPVRFEAFDARLRATLATGSPKS
ncbi:MAG: SUF system Fe-S cluster assembly regulator [Steroidobacteraceae bacterium]